LRLDTFSEKYIKEIILKYPLLIHVLYRNFHYEFYPLCNSGAAGEDGMERSNSLALLESSKDMNIDEIHSLIKKTVATKNEKIVFECLLTFNQHILKTNFFMTTKVALSFRLDPTFLSSYEYPQKPFGLFFMVGREFRGFHVRFADVARGGIRVIRSPTQEVYRRNVISLFDENYNLALTQQLKNKDIPEGGSKGIPKASYF
jgi:glutamate dehydrogenase